MFHSGYLQAVKWNNLSLFIVPALIWGSTWFVIKFQLGTVDPLWSVAYRFLMAGILLIIYCKWKKISLDFPISSHLRIALQGSLLFGFNYWLVYVAEQELTSALMAVLFSGIMSLNILFSWIFLKRKSTFKVFLGSLMGITGTFLIFYQELKDVAFSDLPVESTLIGILSVIIASLGNVTSAANQKLQIKVVPSNALGMLYGSIIMMVVAAVQGIAPTFDFSVEYWISLGYLAVFGSIAAFSTYLTLIGRIGPDRAAYVLIVIPVIALVLSTLFENFNFSWYALLGIILILTGNLTIIKK